MKSSFHMIVIMLFFVTTNGGVNGNLTVIFGSPLATESTSDISTTTASSITRSSSPSSVSSSMESTAAISISQANITAAVLSEERTYISETLLSLQIPLAVFVVISTISAILNIFFFIKIRLRNKSRTQNTNGITNRRTGNEPNAENYTELGNTVSGESENQYDSITRQDNYVNTNVS